MALEICAMLASLYCAAFTPELASAGPITVETVALQPLSEMPEPCLVGGRSCLDLTNERFALCLTGSERCKPDVEVRNLVSTRGQVLATRR